MGTLALIPDNPTQTPAMPLVLADTPVPAHAEADNVIPHVEGGENAVQVPLELAMQHDIESATDIASVVRPRHGRRLDRRTGEGM
jgi:hypothetical protein